MKPSPPFFLQSMRAGLLAAFLLVAWNTQAESLHETGRGRLSAKLRAGVQTVWSEARDEALARAINPGEYDCSPSLIGAWFEQKLIALQPETLNVLFGLDVLSWPTYLKLLVDNNAADAYIGVDGRSTAETKKRLKDMQRFWDVYTQDVILEGMHGIDISKDELMVPLLGIAYGVPPADAQFFVDLVQEIIVADPALGFNNPIFTANAFAVSYEGELPVFPWYGFSDKIVMGDGVIEFLNDIGLGSHGPDMIMAHEFGHHVQFELGVFDIPVPPENQPEETRRTELMADAFGAYFAAHSRGAAFQARRIVQVFEASYAVGDCFFTNPGHHGTPNQRAAAAQWAAHLAEAAQKQGTINSATLMLQLFQEKLPEFEAVDRH